MAKQSRANSAARVTTKSLLIGSGHLLGGISYFLAVFGYAAVFAVIAAAAMNLVNQLSLLLTEPREQVEAIAQAPMGASATIFDTILLWVIGFVAVVASLAAIVYVVIKAAQLCSRFVHFLASKLNQTVTLLTILIVKAGLYFMPVVVSVGLYIAHPSQLMLAILWWSLSMATAATVLAALQSLVWRTTHKNVKNIL